MHVQECVQEANPGFVLKPSSYNGDSVAPEPCTPRCDVTSTISVENRTSIVSSPCILHSGSQSLPAGVLTSVLDATIPWALAPAKHAPSPAFDLNQYPVPPWREQVAERWNQVGGLQRPSGSPNGATAFLLYDADLQGGGGCPLISSREYSCPASKVFVSSECHPIILTW